MEIYTPTEPPSTRVPKRPNEELRDYFAGQALAGLLSDQDRDLYPHEYAELSYKIADAMLKEREK